MLLAQILFHKGLYKLIIMAGLATMIFQCSASQIVYGPGRMVCYDAS